MFDHITPGFTTDYLVRAAENYDLHDRETRPLFAAVSAVSFLKKIEEESPSEIDCCENAWNQACMGNTLFVGEKGEVLTTFLFGTEQCLILTYALDSQNTKWEVISEGFQSMGNMAAVFLMGQFKEQGIIKKYLRVDPEQCNQLYQSLKMAIEDQKDETNARVFSYENWKLVYGNYPFNHALLTQLQNCDGEEVVEAGNSLLGNPQFMLKSRRPVTSFGIIATRQENEDDLEEEQIKENNELATLMLASQMEIMLPIPYSFSTPALLMTENTLTFAMVSPSSDKQGFFTLQSEEEYPFGENLQSLFNEIEEDRRIFANGFLDTEEKEQVYLLNLDQLRRYANALVAAKRWHLLELDEENANRYFGYLFGFTDEYEMEEAKNQYEEECRSILEAIGNEEYAVRQDIIRERQEEAERRMAEIRRQEEARRRDEELRRLEEERRRNEALKRQEEERRKQAELLRFQSGSLRRVNTFYTKLAGVTYSNTGSNTESRQRIIRDLSRTGKLDRGQELRLVQEPTNPYDNHAVAVFGPDGRQLGYLPKEIARRVFDEMNRGTIYKVFVNEVTGGSVDMVYGVNVRVESYEKDYTSAYAKPSYSTYNSSSYNGNDYSDFEDINDIARGEGFSIDDDGHWVPLDDEFY